MGILTTATQESRAKKNHRQINKKKAKDVQKAPKKTDWDKKKSQNQRVVHKRKQL